MNDRTSFYVSGFLYNTKTNRILLLQSKALENESPKWSMVGGESQEGEEEQATFLRIIKEKLGLKLDLKNIYPIYDYFDKTIEKDNHVLYAEVDKASDFKLLDGNTLNWITFPESLKLLYSKQTKQDILIGERVIKAKYRNEQELSA